MGGWTRDAIYDPNARVNYGQRVRYSIPKISEFRRRTYADV